MVEMPSLKVKKFYGKFKSSWPSLSKEKEELA
jgi:hypothetical protein